MNLSKIIWGLFFLICPLLDAEVTFIHAWYKSSNDIHVWIQYSDADQKEFDLSSASDLSKIDGVKDLAPVPANVDRIFVYYSNGSVNRISYHLNTEESGEIITRNPTNSTLLAKINTAKLTLEAKADLIAVDAIAVPE